MKINLLANKSTRRSRGLLFDNNWFSDRIIYGCFALGIQYVIKYIRKKNNTMYIFFIHSVQSVHSVCFHMQYTHTDVSISYRMFLFFQFCFDRNDNFV
jgi:hypothetical protein